MRASKTTAARTPRERAARALCRKAGNPENASFEGSPMWMSYLDEVDVVLQAALSPEEWECIRGLDDASAGGESH